jgi:hypothetical protein
VYFVQSDSIYTFFSAVSQSIVIEVAKPDRAPNSLVKRVAACACACACPRRASTNPHYRVTIHCARNNSFGPDLRKPRHYAFRSHNRTPNFITQYHTATLTNRSHTMTMATVREEKTLSDLPNGHMRNQHEYSYRLPTAPRIVVPPPTLTTDMPGLSLGGAPGGDVDMGFLNELDLEDIIQKNTLLEWAYERRRQAQMILPWLYLGPMVAARDKDFLEREGITMVLAIRSQAKSMTGAMQVATQVCMEVASIESPNFYSLTAKFPNASRLINSHVARVRQHSLETAGQATLGKVLVFCESGNEKSAAVVAAYLMQTLNSIDHIKAMQVCQAQRFCVNFDDVLKNILRSYWDILCARRSIAASCAQTPQQNGLGNGYAQPGSLSVSSSSTKQKRGIEDTQDGDDDTNMEGGMDASDMLRFTGRDVTPFQDR